MTWRWEVDDLDFRVTFARMQSPTDFLTMSARKLVSTVTAVMALVLFPVDIVARTLTRIALKLPFIFVVVLFLLMVLDIVWMAVWGMLVGSSWLWINHRWLRPFLILPGILVAILAHTSIMIAPDPNKNSRYTMLPREWPLSWHVWSPPEGYSQAKSQA